MFVTATDTGVGKTVLAAALCAVLRARGEPVAAFKPAVTGLDDPEPGTPFDHVLLAACTGQDPGEVTPHTFGPAVSPHLAAAQAGLHLDPDVLADRAHAVAGGRTLICEGVGGLLVPLSRAATLRDFAMALGLPVIVAARPGLGTINHTCLTVEAAQRAGLDVRAVVLTPWPREPSLMMQDNAETIADRARVDVHVLPRAAALTPVALAAAAAGLPVDAWL